MIKENQFPSGLVGGLLLAASLLLLCFHTLPAQKQIKQLQTRANAIGAEIRMLENKGTDKWPDARISEVERKELSDAIPETIEQDSIIMDLNRIARQTDVGFNALTFSLQTNNNLPAVNIAASFQGAPQNIIRFLKALETNARKFIVKDAGVSRASTESGLKLMNLNVNLQAFYRKEE